MTINITQEISGAYADYLEEVVDSDFTGRPIRRRDTQPFKNLDFVGIVDFAAGFQAGRKALIALPVIDPSLLEVGK